MSGMVKAPVFGHKKKQTGFSKKTKADAAAGVDIEEELLAKEFVTPDDVMRLSKISQGKP